jgi:hypothetical protein
MSEPSPVVDEASSIEDEGGYRTMKSNLMARAALAITLALPLLGAAAAPAGACENGVEIVVDTNTPRIARAEKALNDGQFTLAAVGVLQVFPHIKSASVTHSPLAGRALRLMALATVRTEGALTAGKHWRGTTDEDRSANMRWAIETLRALSKLHAKKPSLETDLAEALSKVEEHKDEALKILARLSEKDLITSAHGYAALARLREASGDKAGSEAAVKRCESMAKKPDICRARGGASA